MWRMKSVKIRFTTVKAATALSSSDLQPGVEMSPEAHKHYLCEWVFVVIFSVNDWGLKQQETASEAGGFKVPLSI